MVVKSLEELNREFMADIYPPCREAIPAERSLSKELGALGLKIAAIIGSIAVIFTFVYGLHYSVEPGMHPSIKDGDLVMYYRWNKNYHAGDLVLLTVQGQKQVRRVIAVAGDIVDITEDGLTINGALQQEPDIYQTTKRYSDGIEFPLALEEGQIFVLGDAREGTMDSRMYGAVDINDTHGTAITILRRRRM
ncbi:MAG: signal peptidase I [Oscillospiraceae bacterium]|nr:signal peptidase I [Oscillospiraceae bacterium]